MLDLWKRVLTHSRAVRETGFSLIEVNLAVLLVAVGLLSLFALFPFGLRESEMGLADTHEAMFADAVLGALEANAAAMDDWAAWSQLDTFKDSIASNVYPIASMGWSKMGVGNGIPFPQPNHTTDSQMPRLIRYQLEVTANGSNRRKAHLRVKSGNYGSFDANAQHYYTEFIYMGM